MPALIGLFVVLIVNLYGVGTLSASVPRWIVIYTLASLSGVYLAVQWRRFDKTDALALVLFGWAALSLIWSGDPGQGAYQLSNAAALLVAFLVVRKAPRASIRLIPEACLVSVIVALITQYLWPWDYGGHGNRNFQTEAILFGLLIGAASESLIGRLAFAPIALVSSWYLIFVNPSKVEWFLAAFSAILWGARAWWRSSPRGWSYWRFWRGLGECRKPS